MQDQKPNADDDGEYWSSEDAALHIRMHALECVCRAYSGQNALKAPVDYTNAAHFFEIYLKGE